MIIYRGTGSVVKVKVLLTYELLSLTSAVSAAIINLKSNALTEEMEFQLWQYFTEEQALALIGIRTMQGRQGSLLGHLKCNLL